MLIFPAIDIVDGKAVRLLKGDYAQMTVYSDDPVSVAKDFEKAGAKWVHLVDLEGAKSGTTPNLEPICKIVRETELSVEVGGGIRSLETVKTYLDCGVSRVILGTAAVKDPAFLSEALNAYGERIAVGVDLKDGFVAIKGWTEVSEEDAFEFCGKMQSLGVKTIICTDISKDGAMQGTNLSLYRDLSRRFNLQIIASGGVSSIADVQNLAKMDLYGAIIGKAYYTKAIDLEKATEVAK
ncbi:MAG: 1-(5-phosphoribosyl)-5-[Clostridia bacterium]|nr:1-(5-phosphoribosyl)-5-[(5-phosphoribosylamino)methylideneamino]imidazole-4-carboxamide isomerase [Clostridia bacterium]